MKPSQPAVTSERRDFAYELKFLVPEDVAERALAWARQNLSPDPHAGGATLDGYCVNSVYLDTAEFDVFHRTGSYGRCKYRVRRYGTEQAVFLERKLKSRGLVGKRRTRVPDEEVSLLEEPSAISSWTGCWFQRRLLARQLKPKCQIAYDRTARVGAVHEGPVRMTVDRNVRAFPANHWQVHENGPWTALLNHQCIIELKYRLTLPAIFRDFIQTLSLQPQPVSKYRLAVQKFGWGASSQEEEMPPVNGELATPARGRLNELQTAMPDQSQPQP